MSANPLSKLTLTAFALVASLPALAADCEHLRQTSTDGMTVTETGHRAAGAPDSRLRSDAGLPAHCRLAAVLAPTSDSSIEMELWLPDDWNGKFLAVGNGGWAGSIGFSAMAAGLRAGYAVASNDTGHQGGSAAFAVGHPEKVVDFAWRAMHEMAVRSKHLVEAYYSQSPRLSYYQGCSSGGRQGMMEAQRFPEDFDAIIAGAPVYNVLALNASQFHSMKALLDDRALALPPEKVTLLHDAVLEACEAHDGVEDGFLNDPLACGFEPKSLQCASGGGESCLTPDQVRSVEDVYAGVRAQDGELLYPGHAKGFELGWRIPDEDGEPSALQTDATRYIAYEDPSWDWHDFDLERDLALARDKAGFLEALDANLSAFKARGGKILFYHGWNDPGPAPSNTIDYYERVLAELGPDQSDWMRLFMMPGMGHCSGGIGPDRADFLGAMEAWVEDGIAPERIEASRIRDGRVEMTRPLCPYPEVAVYASDGDPNTAASFECGDPGR
jgi:Tannase and feruloyl esterase